MPAFVAEHYLSRSDAAAAKGRARAAHRAAQQLTREGAPIRLVHSFFVPEDETCVYMYEAESIDAVQVAAARAELRFERVSEAIAATASTGGL